jgi:ribosomal protein L11 methyltransferase
MVELTLRAPQPLVETVSDALGDELGAAAVVVEDADAGTEDEQALFGEPGQPAPAEGWPRSLLRALFDDAATAEAAAALLAAQPWADGLEMLGIAPLADQDWVRLTQSQFTPVEITPAFWVVPSWHEPPAAAERVIRIDPGLAFGSGSHASTRMCLRWIAAHANAHAAGWHRVLDYGCGSGILAIGAALHGARGIDAVDIDEAAVAATRANAAANLVRLQAGPPALARGGYALVLANILAAPLKLLAPLLAGHVAAGGQLVLAGILERQENEVAAAYLPWLTLRSVDVDGGWSLMTAERAMT